MEQFKGQSRLPKFAVPKRYDIRLKPDLNSCKFTGSVAIDVDIVAETRFLVLNVADISVRSGSVSLTKRNSSKRELGERREDQGSGGTLSWAINIICYNFITTFISNFVKYLRGEHKEEERSSSPGELVQVFQPLNVEIFEEDEILVLEFAEALPIGVGLLAIGYEGVLNDKMTGFYRSTYELNGEKKNMAVTQFEPVDARRCFPCWDEPAFKATFKITLDVPSELVALSNMPIVEEKVDGHLKTVSYQESPIMSTYLVAIVVGMFDYVEDHTSDGVKVRVYCQVGKTNQGKFALHVAVKTLELYKEYFAVPYSLPKLDMIAIPDFAINAMENYGLVTYRETALPFDDQRSAAAIKQWVAIVVTHELAHQWFGNLVTMEWWTHLWLNEGFATWMSYLATDILFPEWKIWTQFAVDSTIGLNLDALEESHPIEVEINRASEINEIFDAVSYKKGASVIRMLQSYLGAECFQRSLASYIKKHASSNTKTEDLWTALEEGSGEPVHKLMSSWTKQKGYPVVTVKVKDQKLEFEQSQFLSSGPRGDRQWIVPITLCFGSYDICKNFLLQTKSDTLDINEILGKENSQSAFSNWIKLNVDQTGFFRVKYDEELAARLKNAIEKKQLSATDRFGILDNSFALCIAQQQSLNSLLTLMTAYKEELDYTVLSNLITVWSLILFMFKFNYSLGSDFGSECFSQMSNKIARIAADAVPRIKVFIMKFFISLLQNSAEKLGWEPKPGESHLDAMLRGDVLTALAIFGDEPTLNESIRRFHAFLDDRNTPLLPPDIRKAAYVAVMQRVNTSNRWGYESLLRVFRESDLSEQKVFILSNLESFIEVKHINLSSSFPYFFFTLFSSRLVGSLASCPDPNITLEVLNFLLSSEVRSQDAVFGVAVSAEGREIAWTWLKDNWEHISATWGSGFLLRRFITSIVTPFASFEKAKEIEEFFASRSNPSMYRTLKQSIEQVHINAKWAQSVRSERFSLCRTLAKP
ncbi:hypothetical protein UlMin_035694 [Ulmus minor]